MRFDLSHVCHSWRRYFPLLDHFGKIAIEPPRVLVYSVDSLQPAPENEYTRGICEKTAVTVLPAREHNFYARLRMRGSMRECCRTRRAKEGRWEVEKRAEAKSPENGITPRSRVYSEAASRRIIRASESGIARNLERERGAVMVVVHATPAESAAETSNHVIEWETVEDQLVSTE
ncbi:12369_t:CDS:2 [Acaulospora colombiana]|uniref:12369_t:CDS:1 n=1 Tax=Acaulospora colombiana TaxID=27376 RepID=A0ACA9NNJ9_9GLOM|nr:12369_t:CDS:2 [Acaulospora colombiana]